MGPLTTQRLAPRRPQPFPGWAVPVRAAMIRTPHPCPAPGAPR